MNIIIENLVKRMKSKQLKDWDTYQLEDFSFTIHYLYTYIDPKVQKEEAQILRFFYDKICEYVNSDRKRGTVLNPGYLNYIDKQKAEGKL
jgi:hypothetical protein